MIPAVPGFAGDLREDAAMGTRAIMDYQYKSINRGEHSIIGRIKAAGVNPEDHIFVFNLRSYDRLNKTPALKEQEEISGVPYADVQNAYAEEVMSGGGQAVRQHHVRGDDDTKKETLDDKEKRRLSEQKKKFEAAGEKVGMDKDAERTSYTIAKSAMLGEPKPSEEFWDKEDPEQEKENFVQEELYIHSKLCIVDDRVVICGSSNINDRVSWYSEMNLGT